MGSLIALAFRHVNMIWFRGIFFRWQAPCLFLSTNAALVRGFYHVAHSYQASCCSILMSLYHTVRLHIILYRLILAGLGQTAFIQQCVSVCNPLHTCIYLILIVHVIWYSGIHSDLVLRSCFSANTTGINHSCYTLLYFQ